MVDDEPHVAAGAAIATVGPAHRRVRLPPERHTPGTAIATLNVEPTLINELRHPGRLRGWPRGSTPALADPIGVPVNHGQIADAQQLPEADPVSGLLQVMDPLPEVIVGGGFGGGLV